MNVEAKTQLIEKMIKKEFPRKSGINNLINF